MVPNHIICVLQPINAHTQALIIPELLLPNALGGIAQRRVSWWTHEVAVERLTPSAPPLTCRSRETYHAAWHALGA